MPIKGFSSLFFGGTGAYVSSVFILSKSDTRNWKTKNFLKRNYLGSIIYVVHDDPY